MTATYILPACSFPTMKGLKLDAFPNLIAGDSGVFRARIFLRFATAFCLISLGQLGWASRGAAEEAIKPTEIGEMYIAYRVEGSKYQPAKTRVFVIGQKLKNSVIKGFHPEAGDKLRIAGFGLSKPAEVKRLMSQHGNDVVLHTPSRPSIRLENVRLDAIEDANFQLELDRDGLFETFADDFDRLDWDSEGRSPEQQGKSVWRTNYGYGSPDAQASHTFPDNLQVYADPAFKGTAEKPLGVNPFHLVDGTLQIWAEPASDAIKPHIWGRSFTSGLITTKASFSQLYGVFEMRARLPKGKGFWPAFWLLPVSGAWPPEIDILEVLGHDMNTLNLTVHSNAEGFHTSDGLSVPVTNMASDFHIYAVDWEEDTIRWYFDGVEVARRPAPKDMTTPSYMLINLGVGGAWPGSPDATTKFPGVYAIDWVRAYRRR